MIRLRRSPRPGRHRRADNEPTLAPGIRSAVREAETEAISPQTRARVAGYVQAHHDRRARSALVRFVDRFRSGPEEG